MGRVRAPPAPPDRPDLHAFLLKRHSPLGTHIGGNVRFARVED
jgi:hypothetical protein